MHNNTPKKFVKGMRFTIRTTNITVNGYPARRSPYASDIHTYHVVGIWQPDNDVIKHLGKTTQKAIHIYGDEINGPKYVYVESSGLLQGVEYIELRTYGESIKIYATDCIGGE